MLGATACLQILNAVTDTHQLRDLVSFLHQTGIVCHDYFHPTLGFETICLKIKLSACLTKTKTSGNKSIAALLERLIKDPAVSFERLVVALPETVD